MQLISRYSKGVRSLLCVIDVFSKYPWVVPLKDTKGVSIAAAFQSILKQSNRKPNKIWVDKGSGFYNTSFKKWRQNNDVVMYSTHNEGKFVVAERFIRTIKSKIYKYMTSISENVYIGNVTALNRGTSIYLTNLLGMFDILTQQEIAKVKPYICQGNCLNIRINHC